MLIATDGSAAARAALSTAVSFPWPAGTVASAVVAKESRAEMQGQLLTAAFEDAATRIAETATRDLNERWKSADVKVVAGTPADVIVNESTRLGADVVVMGWRGHGAVRRHLMGSVSRRVVRHTPASVLIVRRERTDIRRVVLAFDGSSHAQRAVDLLAQCAAPRGGRVTVLTTVDPLFVSAALVPASERASLERDAARVNRERLAQARQAIEAPARVLSGAGWSVSKAVTHGEPLLEVLAAVRKSAADLVVVGAGGQSGSTLIGAVAEGVLNRATIPVLIAK